MLNKSLLKERTIPVHITKSAGPKHKLAVCIGVLPHTCNSSSREILSSLSKSYSRKATGRKKQEFSGNSIMFCREGNGNPLQFSCLENPMDGGACSPWGRKESYTTERLHFHFSLSWIREGNGNPFQCSCLENPRDGEAWWAAIYGVTHSDTTEAT